jgi:hypothetical protein
MQHRDFSNYENASLGFHSSRDLHALKRECEEYKRTHRTPKPAVKQPTVNPPALATARNAAPSAEDADTEFLRTEAWLKVQRLRRDQ